MIHSRRRFLGGAAAIASAVAAAPTLAAEDEPTPELPAAPLIEPPIELPIEPQAETPPPFEVIALNRMAYGPRPGDLARVRAMGLTAYVDEQLNPNDANDAEGNARLAAARLRIQYAATGSTPAVDEQRPLRTVIENWNLGQLWPLRNHPAFQERNRPADEVRGATWVRAIYSKWQLREVLVEFWHNHFNVDAYMGDSRITATWPLYDQIMRRNALGNFRTMLEEVAKSVAMQYYLDNAVSRDGPANENYARELFELHTLGQPNYLNNLYNRWRDVPGALTGNPVGYIDQDVYEAARAFTGWTIANGQTLASSLRAPDTGEFYYYDGWHDNAQKRVLAFEIDPNQPPQLDGKQVLDLVANHPGTARYVCTKLCQRLVADEPPAELVQRAADAWTASRAAPDQIRQTVRAILLAPEFTATWGAKVKRPFELIAAFVRATGAEFTLNASLFSTVSEMGYRHFNWAPPTGHPDDAPYWLSTNVMLRRWNVLLTLIGGSLGATFDLPAQSPAGATSRQIVDFWIDRLLGRQLPTATRDRIVDFLRQTQAADVPPTGSDQASRISHTVALIGMTPEYQER
jgi:uncharacterized protein (DUF1800 family)